MRHYKRQGGSLWSVIKNFAKEHKLGSRALGGIEAGLLGSKRFAALAPIAGYLKGKVSDLGYGRKRRRRAPRKKMVMGVLGGSRYSTVRQSLAVQGAGRKKRYSRKRM